SSRRRHTISKRDWSSDVCSSDLLKNEQYEVGFMGENRKDNRQIKFRVSDHEYEELEQTANNFHMSVPAFAKKRALGYRMKPPKVDKSGAIEIAKQLRA